MVESYGNKPRAVKEKGSLLSQNSSFAQFGVYNNISSVLIRMTVNI